nr:bifunctional homocysteine S-methyltransferase/methylenetetrahydrofolate reductase [uncultured Cellulosilyticum sp.]
MRNDGTLLIFDGAMGTYYANHYHKVGNKCELANIEDAEKILEIHKAYIEAGCNAIKTNTFGANTVNLECDFTKIQDVIKAGYHLAIEAAKDTDVSVFADIGPISLLDQEELIASYKQIVDTFIDLGAKNFLFETFSTDEGLVEVAEHIKAKVPEAYILVSFAISPEGFTRLGQNGKSLIQRMLSSDVIDATGFNCFSGPKHLLHFMESIDVSQKPIAIMPNTGYPTVIDNRTFFSHDSQYFARQMVEIVKQGAKIIGGCCGTTPLMMAEVVKEINQSISEPQYVTVTRAKSEDKKALSFVKETGNMDLMDKIRKGKKIIAVELDPPIDTEIEFFMSSAKKLQEIGVDTITIADCPIARARVDSSLLACKLKRDLGITPIPHMTCRDRNINATKALLLGLNIEGVRDVLVVTGDPIPTAQRDEIKAIFNFNSKILANYIRELNETSFGTPFNIYGALNINAVNFESELRKAKQKVESGVTMFLTQPVLTAQAVENIKRAHEELEAKILGGIIPVVSYRNACFMNNEISGINVADEIISLYEEADKERASKLAVTISTEIARTIETYVDGYYLITPFKRIDLITEIVRNIKEASNLEISY